MSAVTDEMVEAALPSYSEGGCSGLDEQERREVVRNILEAAFALLPAQTEPDAGRVEGIPSREQMLESALTAAVETIQDYLAYTHDGDPWSEDSRAMGEMDINDYGRDGRLDYALSLLPTPPSPPREEIEHQGVVAVGVKG